MTVLCNCTLVNLTDDLITTVQAVDEIHIVELVVISVVFLAIGLVGLIGNGLVVVFVIRDKRMRSSITNLFITNLAVADLVLMTFNIPEIVMFLLNRGWVLGEMLCKLERFVLVFSVYASVLTLLAVCIERFIAITHPMHARIVCSRRRIHLTIALIWTFSILCAVPVLLFNTVIKPAESPVSFCAIRFPHEHVDFFVPYKFTESVLYYYIPMICQFILYPKIIRRLATSHRLHRTSTTAATASSNNRTSPAGRRRDTIGLRKNVVKMLLASVIIYCVSYSPHQMMLIYNTVAPRPFHRSWMLLVFVEMMTFINSASNPILYCIFSRNFRVHFYGIFQRRRVESSVQIRYVLPKYDSMPLEKMPAEPL